MVKKDLTKEELEKLGIRPIPSLDDMTSFIKKLIKNKSKQQNNPR